MNVAVVVAIAALPVTGLLSWALWLLFNTMIARWYGPDGLKTTPQVARAFRSGSVIPLPHNEEVTGPNGQ